MSHRAAAAAHPKEHALALDVCMSAALNVLEIPQWCGS